jgi:Nif-specific regulatory protein
VDDPQDELARVRRERDLYRRLLELGSQRELEPFLRQALGLMVEVADAHQGYLELHDNDDPEHRRWWLAHGFSEEEIEAVRSAVSQGIIAEALATGRTIETASALLDPRFRDRRSVQAGRIEAVLCAPIGVDPPVGVIYVQRRERPGAFPADERTKIETFAQHLAPLADRLLSRQRAEAARPVQGLARFDGVMGRSVAMEAVLRQVALIAPLDVTVLLTGESGTGKSHLARVIHDNGTRAAGPFVELNCGAIPEGLVESELFGALPGSHSAATRRMEGKVAAATRGTLFLDEVGELPPTVQAKLLQLLHAKRYYPLGATKPEVADVRIIAATNTDLERAVAERRFREDLFYRLQVLPIRVPSLAERVEDIPDLVAFFCREACVRHGLPRLVPSPGAIRAAQTATWPGNVRQLAHAVEAATIRAAGEGATQLESRHLFRDAARTTADVDMALSFHEHTRQFQRQLVRTTLEECDWNVTEAAKRLDLGRTHVYNLIKTFGLTRE